MNTAELFATWTRAKSEPAIWQLGNAVTTSYEHRRATCGPSGYAFVSLRCEPSEALALTSAAEWPTRLSAGYVNSLKRAIAVGVVDALVARDYLSAYTCAVTLVEIGWDDVQSGELAFYRATKAALSKVIGDASVWRLVERG